MTKLNIFCLDDTAEKDCIVSLSEGDHIIGRGKLLKINDHRVSRKHALINVTEQNITLTSLHENPCFFKAHNSQTLTIIRQNEANPLQDGDHFALLPDDLWFRVRVEKGNIVNGAKRLLDHEAEDITNKKTKLAEPTSQSDDWNFQITELLGADEPSTSHNLNETVTENHHQPEPAQNVEVEKESEQVEVKQEPEDQIEIKEEPKSLSQEAPVEVEVKVEPADVLNEPPVGDDGGAQAVGDGGQAPKKAFRERCWYGDRCFRRNPNHREQFAHPGDPDYQSDPEDDRPLCPYGATCYRVNPEHRRDYKHLGKPAPKPPAGQAPSPANPPKKKRAPKKKPKKDQSYDSEDDYDYDDPFLNDDSDDDFQPTDDSESEFDDSQESKEGSERESQDRRRMLAEAKKFMKENKKDDKDE